MKTSKIQLLILAISFISIFSCTKDIGVTKEDSKDSKGYYQNNVDKEGNKFDLPERIRVENKFETLTGQAGFRRDCVLGMDDLDVNIAWEEDCSLATITLSLCCDCFNETGIKRGCTINPATIFMQVEYSPFTFQVFEHQIEGITIQNGKCYEINFVLENSPKLAGITQFDYNGQPVDITDLDLDTYCPYE